MPPSTRFPFESRYATVNGHRIHYVEQGEGDPVVFIHGNPTHSYLWRNILPGVASGLGRRGIAFDLLGFGRSDKPALDYSAQLHYDTVRGFVDQLGLKNLVLVTHDWGGTLGARYAVDHPDNVQALAALDCSFWSLGWKDFPKEAVTPFKIMRGPLGFLLIQVFNAFVGKFIPMQIHHKEHLSPELMKAYREPFPSISSRKAMRDFPRIIPVEGQPPASHQFFEQLQSGLARFQRPMLYITTKPGMGATPEEPVKDLKRKVPQLEHLVFEPCGHFLQEDDPERLTRTLVDWAKRALQKAA